MGSRETSKEPGVAGTPDDVAVLYSWANLHGAKYRDFSASRREYRAQVRYRAAQALRDRELEAQAAAEAAAAAAERAALAAESAAKSNSGLDSQAQRVQALRNAEAAARKAAAERVEAARRAEAAAQATVVAEREGREISEAHASAERQALVYTESEARRHALAGPQPRGSLLEVGKPESQQTPRSEWAPLAPGAGNIWRSNLNSRDPVALLRPQGYRPDDVSGVWQAGQPEVAPIEEGKDVAAAAHASRLETVGDEGVGPAPLFSSEAALDPEPDRRTIERALERAAAENVERSELRAETRPNRDAEVERASDADSDSDAEQVGPAWLYAPPQTPRPRATLEVTPSFAGETLQGSRERVASRWFALKGVFENAAPELPAMQPPRSDYTGTPLLLVFSLAGGVGKTSLVAALGRALSAQGEKVLLTDTTSHGLLPFYFGARELRPGAMRTFSPPEGSNDAPIYLVSYQVEYQAESRGEGEPTPELERRQQSLIDEIFRTAQDCNRIVLDLSAGASWLSWLIRGMANLHPTVLIPMAPDMNSVISLHTVERFFQGIVDSDGRPLLPFYVLNQFDATLPLHLDVREVFRRQLGDRLLNIAIRRSPSVSEALAEGMTVIDYAPDAAVSKDYFNVSAWLRSVSPVSSAAEAGFEGARWSEE